MGYTDLNCTNYSQDYPAAYTRRRGGRSLDNSDYVAKRIYELQNGIGNNRCNENYAPVQQQQSIAQTQPGSLQPIMPVASQPAQGQNIVCQLNEAKNELVLVESDYRKGVLSPQEYSTSKYYLEQKIASLQSQLGNNAKEVRLNNVARITGRPVSQLTAPASTAITGPAQPTNVPLAPAFNELEAPKTPVLTVEQVDNEINKLVTELETLKTKKERKEISQDEYDNQFKQIKDRYNELKEMKNIAKNAPVAPPTQPAQVPFGAQTVPQAAPTAPVVSAAPQEPDYGLPQAQNSALNGFLSDKSNKTMSIEDFHKDPTLSGVIEAKQSLNDVGIDKTVKILADGTKIEISEDKKSVAWYEASFPRFTAVITKPNKEKETVQMANKEDFYKEVYKKSGLIDTPDVKNYEPENVMIGTP